jgi:hypothetical protein
MDDSSDQHANNFFAPQMMATGTEELSGLQGLDNLEMPADGRSYKLDVVQQPQRARMCGFGDKDRRPITPPPCVRLIVTDNATGKEVDCNDIDHSMYILTVDLWSEDGLYPVNLVRHSQSNPSISSTSLASYNYAPDASMMPITPGVNGFAPNPGFPMSDGFQYAASTIGYDQAVQPVQPVQPLPPLQPLQPLQPLLPGYPLQDPGTFLQNPMMPPDEFASQSAASYFPFAPEVPASTPTAPSMPILPQNMIALGASQQQGMFTRNLIGSLSASAFRLTDPDDKIGIWFILQDLSVRTEGRFRLRFAFVNVADVLGASLRGGEKIKVLAAQFTEVFTVYSAKKFPGVCDSTKYSKCFATQGIKIPIRKEGPNSKDDDEESPDYGDGQ